MAFPFRSRRNHPAQERPNPQPQAGPPPRPPEPAPELPGRDAAVGDEAEAFLQGRLVDYLVANRCPVPAWAALNEVAHATAERLGDLAGQLDDDPTPEAGEPRWRLEQRTLAAKVLESGSTPEAVAEVQRKVLVPLELWLIDRSRIATVTSRRAIEMAWEALDDLRADR